MDNRVIIVLVLLVLAVVLLATTDIPQRLGFATLSSVVAVQPVNQTVYKGSTFSLYINVTTNNAIAGMQSDMKFNPGVININKVTEGNLFIVPPKNATFMSGGIINNVTGSVNNVLVVILGPYNTTKSGTFVKYTGVAVGKGKSTINLSRVLISDSKGVASPVTLSNATINVIFPPWDVNEDNVVDIMDVMITAAYFGTNTPGRWDINNDGIVDILDLMLVASRMG
jgi:hypothetical protein